MKVLVSVPDLRKLGGIACYYAALQEHFSDRVEYLQRGSQLGDKGRQHIARLLGNYYRLVQHLRRGDYEVVHFNTTLAPVGLLRDGLGIVLAKLMGRKVLVSFHGWRKSAERLVDRHFLLPFRLTFLQADTIVVLASEFRDQLRAWGYRGQIELETTTVDAALANVYTEERRQHRDTVTILFLARVEVYKGIYEAVEAYRLLRAEHPHVRLVIAGGGGELEAVQALVAEQAIPDVAFAGFVRGEAKRRRYEEADIYVLPSHGEGMPNSVLEALVVGLPVVTRCVGGLRDFFEDGTMGFATDSQAPAVFAKLLGRLVENEALRHRIGRHNAAYGRSRFLAPDVACRLEAIYARLLGEAAPPEDARLATAF